MVRFLVREVSASCTQAYAPRTGKRWPSLLIFIILYDSNKSQYTIAMIIILEGGDQTRGKGEDQGMGQGKSWKRGGERGVDDGVPYDHDHGVDDGPHLGRDGGRGDNCFTF